MPLFHATDGKVRQLVPAPFANERQLQRFVEENLEELLGARFIRSEFVTGDRHGGRIDTLGLDEVGNPVIVEYKGDKSESIINQGLYYLDWLLDHRGDFQVAVHAKLGPKAEISWQSPRLILIASSYTKYDSYAVNRLLVNVELMRYQRYDDGTFLLETVNGTLSSETKKPTVPNPTPPVLPPPDPNPPEFTLEYHRAKTSPSAWAAFLELRDRLLALDGVEERVNQKSQITFRSTKSFAACSFKRGDVACHFKGPEHIEDAEGRAKDIRSYYQWGYQWSVEFSDQNEVDYVYALVKGAYDREQ